MMRIKFWKKAVSCTLAVGLAVSVVGCQSKQENKKEPGTANEDTSQTEFSVMGGMSALSKGYDDNEVLNDLMQGFRLNGIV